MSAESRLCPQCGLETPESEFYMNKGKPSGWCKTCHRGIYAARRQQDKRAAVDAYGGRCACCGVSDLVFLTIDHIDGGGTQHRKSIGTAALYRWLRLNGYPEGFQPLCWNCNAAKHFAGKCPHQE